MDLKRASLRLHSKFKGKIATKVLTPIKNATDLTLAYTPGVAEVAKVINQDKKRIYDYTIKSHTVAVITDGSAVLGLGNIGAEAALPIMEGKCAIFKTFGDVDAFPICLATQDTQEIIRIVKSLSPVFGGINLEDISAPRCFEIEENLQDLGIPVMHDDQHGTAVVVLAGLVTAAKVVGKKLGQLRVVISGAGAAGHASAKLLSSLVKDVIVLDSKGIINSSRNNLDKYKKHLLSFTNKEGVQGGLREALAGADVFLGVSKGNIMSSQDVKVMAKKPIIFAMANPVPEIFPKDAKKGGAYIVATGRSDYPNQINNSLAFPGIFKGALEARVPAISDKMKIATAHALANLVKNPSPKKIIPGPFDRGVAEVVAKAVIQSI
ncbi:NADP-dependent malic enzyme [Candidatus Daviesbacteria bacterium]|nr:NADP-dependent malic enzyme [Candidatus Daviesbacteria bacterium]